MHSFILTITRVLKLRIQERQPVARLFTASGNSYLIDSTGIQMALGRKKCFQTCLYLPVIPREKFGLRRDSALNRQIRDLAIFLNDDPFWSNQVQEINISSAKTFQMTPLIGNQVIEFGDGNDYENKFHRLFIFYKEVIAQTGFEKYTSINIAYAEPGDRNPETGMISRADSIQAQEKCNGNDPTGTEDGNGLP